MLEENVLRVFSDYILSGTSEMCTSQMLWLISNIAGDCVATRDVCLEEVHVIAAQISVDSSFDHIFCFVAFPHSSALVHPVFSIVCVCIHMYIYVRVRESVCLCRSLCLVFSPLVFVALSSTVCKFILLILAFACLSVDFIFCGLRCIMLRRDNTAHCRASWTS